MKTVLYSNKAARGRMWGSLDKICPAVYFSSQAATIKETRLFEVFMQEHNHPSVFYIPDKEILNKDSIVTACEINNLISDVGNINRKHINGLIL